MLGGVATYLWSNEKRTDDGSCGTRPDRATERGSAGRSAKGALRGCCSAQGADTRTGAAA